MPPKKKVANEASKKTEQKKKEKIIEDKTFGLKNKKGKKQQTFVKQVTQQVKYGGNPSTRKLAQEKDNKVVMVVEVMAAVEDIGSISHRTANTSLPSSKGHGSNRTMASNITVIRSNQAVSRTTSLNNSNSPSSSSMDRDHLTTSTTTTTRDTKHPQDTNRLDMPNSNSTAKLHSNPSNRGLTRITKTTTQDINSKRAMAVTVAQGISRLALIKGITRN